MAGTDGRPVARAGVGGKTAGNIEREDGAGVALGERVSRVDQFGVNVVDGSCYANTEQAIDNQGPGLSGGNFAQRLPACVGEIAPSLRGVWR